MVGLVPGLGPVNGRSWPFARPRVAVALLLGRLLEYARLCSRVMANSLPSLGWESFAWVRYTGFAIREWGLAYGIYPWVSTLVMEIEGDVFG
jgi:hypothetical protein